MDLSSFTHEQVPDGVREKIERLEEHKRQRSLLNARDTAEQLKLLRDSLEECGLIARELKNLKPDLDGSIKLLAKGQAHYQEREVGEWGFTTPHEELKTAYVLVEGVRVASAYLCHPIGSSHGGCGWVKGEPRKSEYNEIGPLSGSAGFDYYCVICGLLIARLAHTAS